MRILQKILRKPLFDLGRVVVTPGIEEICDQHKGFDEYLTTCLALHQKGNWGNVGASDAKSNIDALDNGGLLLSSYHINPKDEHPDKVFWIITDADRSFTTFLLPSEY